MRNTKHRLEALASRVCAVFVLVAVCICSVATFSATAVAQNAQQKIGAGQTAYMVFDGVDTLTLTPTQPAEGATFWQVQASYTKDNLPEWCKGEYSTKIKYIDFAESLSQSDFAPTSTAYWYYGLQNLVRTKSLFSPVVSIDEDDFNYSKVTTAESMFENCTSMTSCNFSPFGNPDEHMLPSSLVNVTSMFKGCSTLWLLQVGLPCNLEQPVVETNMLAGVTSLELLGVPSDFRFTLDCGLDFTGQSMPGSYQWIGWDQTEPDAGDIMFVEMGKDATYETFNNYVESPQIQGHKLATFVHCYVGPLAVHSVDHEPYLLRIEYAPEVAYRFPGMDADWNVYKMNEIYSQTNHPGYWDIKDQITEIYFDITLSPEFGVDWKPTSFAYWFYGLSNVTKVTMFNDWPHPLDTSQLTSMQSMFEGCTSLTSLDFSGWNTTHVTNMSSMVAGCTSLDSLDLSSLETDSLNNMDNMFSGDTNITSLNLASFVANTTDPSTGIEHAVSMNNAFMGLNNLATLTISTAFNFADNSGFNFDASKSWDGKIQGTWQDLSDRTTYTAWNTFINSAGAPYGTVAYFTTNDGGSPIAAYMDLEGNTLYVRYGLINTSDSNEMQIGDSYTASNLPAWVNQHASTITSIVFTENIKENNYKPQSIAYWFSGLTNLKSIYNMFYLQTENIISLDGLFSGDSALETLDFSKVNFPEAATMKDAFKATSALSTFITNNKFAFSNDCAFPFAGQSSKFWALNNTAKMSDSVELWNNTIKSSSAQKLTFKLAGVTLSFDANGGSFDGKELYCVYGNEKEDVPNIPTPSYTGHEFVGWMDKDQKKVSVPSVFPAQDASYAASWKTNQYTVSFDSTGGSAVAPQTVNYDGLVVKPQDPVKDGYTFSGWLYNGVQWHFDTDKVKDNMVLYASWDEVPAPAPVVNPGWYVDAHGWRYSLDGKFLNDGWHYIIDQYGEHWYYFDADTYIATSRWIWDDNWDGWYWVCETGPMIENLWQWIGNAWYGFWWGGKMCTGWVWDTYYNAWYFCNEYNGRVACNEWAWDGAWYYFDQNCHMVTNAWVGSCWLNGHGMWVK